MIEGMPENVHITINKSLKMLTAFTGPCTLGLNNLNMTMLFVREKQSPSVNLKYPRARSMPCNISHAADKGWPVENHKFYSRPDIEFCNLCGSVIINILLVIRYLFQTRDLDSTTLWFHDCAFLSNVEFNHLLSHRAEGRVKLKCMYVVLCIRKECQITLGRITVLQF